MESIILNKRIDKDDPVQSSATATLELHRFNGHDITDATLAFDVVTIDAYRLLTVVVVNNPYIAITGIQRLTVTNYDAEIIHTIRRFIADTRDILNISVVVADDDFITESVVNELYSANVRFALVNGVVPGNDTRQYIEHNYSFLAGDDGIDINVYRYNGALVFTNDANILFPEMIQGSVEDRKIAEIAAKGLREQLTPIDGSLNDEQCAEAAASVNHRRLP